MKRAWPLVFAVASACHGEPENPPAAPGSWSTGPSISEPRFEGAAIAVGDRIYYVGGITGIQGDMRGARASDRVDVFDPVGRVWSSAPALPPDAPRHHLAVATTGGKLYVLGGFTGIIGGADAAGVFLPNASTFVLDAGAWRRLRDQPFARGSASAQVIDGIIYVAGGGIAEPDARADLFSYDPARDVWTQKAPMPTAREHVASCAVGGKLIVIGGWAGNARIVVSAVESYDPATDAWTRLPDLPTARGGLGAVTIADVCYAIGGEHWTSDFPGTFDRNEAFSAGRWTSFAPMPTARHGLGLAAINGAVYAIGGGPAMGNSYTDVVEIFRP